MAKIVKQVWLLRDLQTGHEYVNGSTPGCGDDQILIGGPVSVEFDVPDVARCPHCNKALPEAEKPKLPLLPLVVGGVYRTKRGQKVELISHDESKYFPWEGDNCSTYVDSGREYQGVDSINDLIERIA